MPVAAPVPPVETPTDVDYRAVVEFGLLGLRAEVERAREAALAGDDVELAAARARARQLVTMLGLLP